MFSRLRTALQLLGCVALLHLAPTAPAAAAAHLLVTIDLSEQAMSVAVDGRTLHRWPVSTARKGYRTPVGTYRPIRLERVWYSSIYDNAPMPYSVFFHGGYAIHGTTEIGRLGHPASHGCVRLHPANAHRLFDLVSTYGRGATSIVVRR
ncbi:MAG: L,D-transpeptidase [Rhizobiaceae bacterium]|nr:L,D-transpeptidase [Rhizobiaceae bacterium]